MLNVKKAKQVQLARLAIPALFFALASIASPAGAASGGRYIACQACAPQALAWNEGEFDQVYVNAEKSSQNLHPHTIARDTLAKVLASVRYRDAGRAVPLLDDESAANLANGIASAIAKATPGDDAIFFVTSKMSGGLLGVKLGNSGRAFVDQNGLNIIFGEAHVEFVAAYRATRMERAFNFGSRIQSSKVMLEGEGLNAPRPDWIIVPMTKQATAPNTLQSTGSSQPPALHGEQYYAAQESRLKGLKRLRDQDLITEIEYQTKKADILKAW